MIEAGASSFRLPLHPAMTVVAGAGRLERDGLTGELLTAMGPGRDGVHLELVDDRGTRLAVFRPPGGRHCVVDVERSVDVTERFVDADGRLDPLGRAGLDRRAARHLLRLDSSELWASSQEDELVRRLGRVDQGRLWDVATKVLDRRADEEALAADAGGGEDDAAVIAEIERRHQAFEAAQEAHEQVRAATFLVAGVAGLALLPATALLGLVATAVLTVVALGAAAVSAARWWQHDRARQDEEAALRDVGAGSYLSFTVQRVNGLTVSDHQRSALARATQAHQAAVAEWELLAGDAPVDWALEHRAQIRDMAQQLRRAAGVHSPMASHLPDDAGTATDLAMVVRARLDAARRAGPGGESLPLILDDAFAGLLSDTKADLLSLLLRASADQQVIYLTEDADVAGWARVEALTGALALVEPTAPAEGRTRHGRSVVA